MLRRVDRVPGIAGDDPADRRFVAQRIEILGLAAEHAEHGAILEQPARRPFAHEFLQICAERDVEDRVGLGVGDRLGDAPGVDLVQRCGLLDDELDARLARRHELLERGDRRLAVLVVGIDQCPAFLAELDGLFDQHRCLHVGRGAQPEGVLVAAFPDDLVGQRLRGDKGNLALLGKVGDRKADVREERAGQQHHTLAAHEFLGCPHRVARCAVVVARDDREGPAVDPAGLVNLFDGKLPALAIGF